MGKWKGEQWRGNPNIEIINMNQIEDLTEGDGRENRSQRKDMDSE